MKLKIVCEKVFFAFLLAFSCIWASCSGGISYVGISDSSSTADVKEYDITISSSEHGTVSANKTTAAAGDTVKLSAQPANGYELDTLSVTVSAGDTVMLTITPADGYELESVSVVDSEGNAVAVTETSFIMPESNVTVSATFKVASIVPSVPEELPTYSLVLDSSIVDGVFSFDKTDEIAPGTTVSLTVSHLYAYELTGLSVRKDSGEEISLTEVEAEKKYTFDMPAENVLVSATFNKDELIEPLALEAIDAGAITVTNPKTNMCYALNGGERIAVVSGEPINVSAGDVVQFYADGGASETNILCDSDCYIYGNVMSLLSSGNFRNLTEITQNGALKCLFKGNGHIKNNSEKNILLPATTISSDVYFTMFEGCTSLTKAPALPATNLAQNCYGAMFYNCASLSEAPALPATNLAPSCYINMFYGCESLASAPALPATTLAESCYRGMFYRCASLASAPALPATTLAETCYRGMFYSCKSLENAPELPAATLVDNCYYNMFGGCKKIEEVICHATDVSASNCTTEWLNPWGSSSGTFKCPESMRDVWERSFSGIPASWTIETF